VTAQFQDGFGYEGHSWRLLGISGGELFDPKSVGIHPQKMCSACYRGFVCGYDVTSEGIFLGELVVNALPPEILLDADDQIDFQSFYPLIRDQAPTPHQIFSDAAVYQDVNLPIAFEGGLLLGRSPRRRPDPWRPLPHDFEVVIEFDFSGEKPIQPLDHSEVFLEIDDALRTLFDEFSWDSAVAVNTLDYRQWAVFRQPLEVQRQRIMPYSIPSDPPHKPSDLLRHLRVELKENQRLGKEREERERLVREENDRLVRGFFEQIQRDGWTCTNCGKKHKDYRQSIGPQSRVICRECGWPQQHPR
jgi:hypothetical protein